MAHSAKVVLSAALMLAITPFAVGQEKSEKQAAELVGKYRIVAGQVGAKKIPADQLKDNQVTITNKTISVFDKDQKELYVASYLLDATKKPWVLHMTSSVAPKQDVKSEGLISREGQTLKLIYALPNGKAPDDFQPEEHQQLFVLEPHERN